MTKKEKMDFNKQIGRIWMELRALQNNSKKNVQLHPGWKNIQARHQMFVENNEEVSQAIKAMYPHLFEDIKNLKYANNIDKTIESLNAVVPTDNT